MRIYTRQAFLALPPGTVFSKGKPWYFMRFMVKGKTWTSETISDYIGDFDCRMLDWINSQGDSDQWTTLERMLEQGDSVPLNTMEQRDGCYDDEEIFLVYEPADLDAMIAVCQAAGGRCVPGPVRRLMRAPMILPEE